MKQIASFPGVISQAGKEENPSILASFLYDICKTFSRYYHDNKIVYNDSVDLVATRVALSGGVLRILKNGFPLLGIPFLDKM